MSEGRTTLKVGMPDHVAERLKALCAKHNLTLGAFASRAFATYECLLEAFGIGGGSDVDLAAMAAFLEARTPPPEASETSAGKASEGQPSEASK